MERELTTEDPHEDDGAVDAALFEGHVDAIEAGRIYGWALNPDDPSQRLQVTIHHGSEELGTVVADRFREDLRGYGDGSGRHAFVFTLPKSLWDAEPASFHVVHAGSPVPLMRSSADLRSVPVDPEAVPAWLAPVNSRLAHLENALVATARAAALAQISLRRLGTEQRGDDRIETVEAAQLRLDQTTKAHGALLSGLRVDLVTARHRGRMHLALTVALAMALGGTLVVLLS
ncbi:MAG: hypothetical protein RLO51_24475 [Thalassobaculum sp.]|uniref:hypothetical protein n=1 Tax=Thalassobaculum sp. TaxID=2022740 RepID=UPI0032EAFB70